MSRTPLGDHYPVIPPDEFRCVWMSAGVISYQLCAQKCDCDQCPLDQAIHARPRNVPPGVRDPQATESPGAGDFVPEPPPSRLHRDRLYSHTHCWVLWTETVIGEDALVRVGLEPALAGALLTPRSVIHAESGAEIQRGDTHPWIMTEAGTLGIIAPLSGVLYEANPRLLENPELLAEEPMDEGWLYSLRVPARSAEFDALFSVSAATRLYGATARRFHETLAQAWREAHPHGPALDSVAPMPQGIAGLLGPARYFALLHDTYR